MTKASCILILPLAASLVAFGQTTQTWRGVLIDAGCAGISRTTQTSSNVTSRSRGEQARDLDANGQVIHQSEEQSSSSVRTRTPNGDVQRSEERSKRAETRQENVPYDNAGTADRIRSETPDTATGGEHAGMATEERNRSYEQNSSTTTTTRTDTRITAPVHGKHMDRSCLVSPSTMAYALRLPDGAIIPLTADSNGRVPAQLQTDSRWQKMIAGKEHHKMNVVVTGSMEGDSIRVDSIHY